MPPIVVSVDWDFFLWRGSEAKFRKVKIFPGTPREQQTDAWQLFDWGHNEGFSPLLQAMLWQSRFVGFLRLGLDPLLMTGNRVELGCTPIDEFLAVIEKKLDFAESFQWIADSHAMGMAAVKEGAAIAGEPVHVINFDAHADLGYEGKDVRQQAKKDVTDCSAWLWHALRLNQAATAEIVYPDWRDDEWASVSKGAHLKPLLKRVRATKWSEWAQRPATGDPVVCSIIVRSSAWTPPWYDDGFEQLYRRFPGNDLTCLDCSGWVERPPGGHDACQKREFDVTAAQAELETVQSLWQAHSERERE